MYVEGYSVAAYLDKNEDAATIGLAEVHLPIVAAMVRAYVRGNGYDDAGNPNDDLAAVIIASCARLTANPAMLTEQSEAVDDFSRAMKQAVFNGWTLPELAILHRYRKRAM